MKLFLTSILLLTSVSINAATMKFKYQSYDGELIYDCDHKIANDIMKIYDVYCFDQQNRLKKKFSANVIISQYTRSFAPKTSLEIIYRVTDSTRAMPEHGGSTHWVHMHESSPVSHLSLSQSVENDIAGLYLDIIYTK
jgi:hypothetical protein